MLKCVRFVEFFFKYVDCIIVRVASTYCIYTSVDKIPAFERFIVIVQTFVDIK